MALFHINFFSQVLCQESSIDVIIPQKRGMQKTDRNISKDFPVLWLLHGATDDYSCWQRFTSIERYVEDIGIAAVMPSAQLSCYTNMAYGYRYFDYITQELPEICNTFFHFSQKREDNYIAGVSMGGYGALKAALKCPNQYSAACCLSAGNNYIGPHGREHTNSSSCDIALHVFGVDKRETFDIPEIRGTEHDLFYLADEALKEGKKLPRIFHACGTEDFLLDVARRTRDYFSNIIEKVEYEYYETDGAHTWDFWNEWIQKFLVFIKRKSCEIK